MDIKPFNIAIPQTQLDDLYKRLEATRWPVLPKNNNWERGTHSDYLQSLVRYWLDDFDWRKQEADLNQFSHYQSEVKGEKLHFIYQKGKGKSPTPLILTHGWPDSFYRYHKIIPMLTDPEQFGGSTDDSFDVIIPSIPGFGFSEPSSRTGLNNSQVAELWHELMTQILGYKTYMAGGGDIGSGVSRYLAAKYPNSLIGLHLTDVGIIRDLLSTQDSHCSDEELNYKKSAMNWLNQEGGYMSLQATKPSTLAFGLNDSPVGLASWIIEKFRSWSDCGGELDKRYSKDELLTNIMIYWFTGTIGSSINMYYENMHGLPSLDGFNVPCAIARFGADILLPPKVWTEQKYNVVQWSDIAKGGHFTAMEEPLLFVEDIRSFARILRQ
ncbi:epoxide hydrolase family protein [Vibrio diazotrophicus]|uniref:epoxide hydrolase family protein n=1 Tax=Vibrio diazotrophicus TaxID=685 RepID=UPI00142D7DED|nr:epoxide hydrolase family protein [Vibrio diazotrophicus]NIY91957.1 epoxide hydrolase [Vibrio diazotrophicus]